MVTNSSPRPLRTIKSYVRRSGRMTEQMKSALAEKLQRHGGQYFQNKDLSNLLSFRDEKPCILEIGFGMGTSLIEMALANPEQHYIGVEVHKPGLLKVLASIEEYQVQNLKIIEADAIELLKEWIPCASLAGVFLFFPDPWPKLRHHKRRIVQPEFIELIANRLTPGGIFHACTDWQPYAKHMLEVLSNAPQMLNTAGVGNYCPRPVYRPETKFEKRGVELGHGVWDLVFKKV